MTDTATDPSPADPAPLTSYQVTWTQKGTDNPQTTQCIVNADDMTRPGDPEQRNDMIRRMIAIRHLPTGFCIPDNVQLLDVQPICNCEPYPGENCTYAHHDGQRFTLTGSSKPGFERIVDRHDRKAVALVLNTLSVEVLTLIRHRYEHQ